MRWVIALAMMVLTPVVAAVVPALAAAPMTVRASNFQFTPATVAVDAGDMVTFANDGGTHNFVFDDGSGAYPPSPAASGSAAWTGQQRTFPVAGTYTFHCGMHPDSMHGTVQVSAAAPGPSPSPSPSPGPAPPSAIVRDVHLPRTTFCVRHCRHPGVVVKLELASAARVRGTLTRKGHRFGRLDFGTVKTGKHTLRFTRTTAGKRLARGRYVLALRIGTEPARTLRFRVS